MRITLTIVLILTLASSLSGCFGPAYGLSSIQMCPGYANSVSDEMTKPHVCNLADKLSIWKAREWEKIRNHATSNDSSLMRSKLNQ